MRTFNTPLINTFKKLLPLKQISPHMKDLPLLRDNEKDIHYYMGEKRESVLACAEYYYLVYKCEYSYLCVCACATILYL